ncbi:hypothetical protein BD770DRAFT_440206 [Pilaira anomala]|nr:hypothetical protein BD770DRAFT_440206 [Pilaira anomala]
MNSFTGAFEAVISPKLIITVCGTLEVHVVFRDPASFIYYRVKTSNETMMDQLLKTKFCWRAQILGDCKTEKFVDSLGIQRSGSTIDITYINCITKALNRSLLLLLYKYAINNYSNKDLVNAYATLHVVKDQFDNLWNTLFPLVTFKFVEPKMDENTKKGYKEHTMKTLDYVDKSLLFYENMSRRNPVSLWSRAVTEVIVHALSSTDSNTTQNYTIQR